MRVRGSSALVGRGARGAVRAPPAAVAERNRPGKERGLGLALPRLNRHAGDHTRFVPDVLDGYVPLDEAAHRLACARQTVLNKVQRGELDAIQVTNGQRKGLRIKVPAAPLDQLLND